METNPFREILNIYMQKVGNIENYFNLLSNNPNFEIPYIEQNDMNNFILNLNSLIS